MTLSKKMVLSIREKNVTKRYKYQPHVYEYIWVLDASFGDVLRIEIPANFPENGDHEDCDNPSI